MLAKWVAVDWGTTNLRIWVFGPDGMQIDHKSSDKGMGALAPDEFEAALLELIGAHLSAEGKLPVICCGMVGARQGWIEAPYVSVPCAPPGIELAAAAQVTDPRLDVRILPGVSQNSPADVMRGEETQIAGFLSSEPEFDGVLCLPGTHTKWVHISAGEIVYFRTFMTGELFALLSKQSVLRHGLGGDGWDEESFISGIDQAEGRPQSLTADLFSLRASGLLHGLAAGAAKARLSGLLIGLELAGARPYWLGQRIVVVGSDGLAKHYQTALSHLGAMAETANGSGMTLNGLRAAYETGKETS